MKLGMFSMPIHGLDRDWLTVLREDQEAVILADQLGYSEFWIGEHFTSKPEQIISPLMFLATVIDQTRQINFGTAVIGLPHHHPAIVAGEVAMFDQLSEGRCLLGIGPGSLMSDAEIFDNMDVPRRIKMMLEAIDTIVAIWSQDPPYRIKGEYWDISLEEIVLPHIGVGVIGKPYQRPHPPIAIALRSLNSATAGFAGERGWIPISGGFVPTENIATHWPLYAEGCEKAGRKPDPSIWRVGRSILVTENDAEAEDYVNDPDGMFRFYFRYLLTLQEQRINPGPPDEAMQAIIEERAIETVEDLVIAGSPDTVLDKLVAFRDTVGDFGTLIATGHDWDDKALWQRSMRLLAENVAPRLGRHASASRAAE